MRFHLPGTRASGPAGDQPGDAAGEAVPSPADAGTAAAGSAAAAQRRIAELAARRDIHRAFHWLHLHQPQLRLWQLEMLAIPAPPFGERARAEWFAERFAALGLQNVHLDEAGNALGELRGAAATGDRPLLLVSAHLDTVFPAGTPTLPVEEGARILCPGASDNAAGLSGLLGLVAALRYAGLEPARPILFAANVGEEGEGDLRGMRHLFREGPYRGRIAAALALEGAGTSTAVTRALGSRRFRVTIEGPGGHSWADAAVPNPILLMARALTLIGDRVTAEHGPASEAHTTSRTTFSAGQISGGTSINSIPVAATVLLDLRSSDAHELERVELAMHRAFESVVSGAASPAVRHRVEVVGSRPAGSLPEDASLLSSLRAVDRHLGLPTESRLGSTDANLPLALGVPAMAIPAGGTGGGIHTLGEWYDPTGRETALRRLLLLVVDQALVADQAEAM